MKLDVEALTLETRYAFKIAREERKKYKNFIFSLSWEGIVGVGEAAPQAYYGEDEKTVLEAIRRLEGKLDGTPEEVRERLFSGDLRESLGGDASVRAALDMALWDIIGQREGKPCYELLSLDPQKTPYTSYTIGFDTLEVIEEKVRESEPYKILKVKMGIPGDLEVLDTVIRLSGKTVRADANEGWDLPTAIRMCKELKKRGVEFIEQPISHLKGEDLGALKRSAEIPVVLDESIINPEDVEPCRDRGHGVNIKLMKCGGIAAALEIIRRAREADLKVMLGCMIETSVAITAAAHLSPLVDYADLDGNLLLAEDPFCGVLVEEGKLILPGAAGLGVARKA